MICLTTKMYLLTFCYNVQTKILPFAPLVVYKILLSLDWVTQLNGIFVEWRVIKEGDKLIKKNTSLY